jgi:formylglycine-generating enzyme required for sulfatase activity
MPSASAASPSAPDEAPRSEACPSDMILVDGYFCPFVAHRCKTARRAAAGEEPVCEEFEPEVLCEGSYEHLRCCVDVFEYPNQRGVLPAVLVSFDEAARACETEGKRLCDPRELAFACEGEAVHPYAVGERRLEGTCRWDAGAEGRVTPSRGANVAPQLALLDRRVPSGDSPRCVSPFGVFDLAGNVAEWAYDPQGSKSHEPFASVVAGGAWGASASTCRAGDTSHAPAHRAATLGFRCCSDASPAENPPPARRPNPRRGFRPIGPPP